jgi:hypothetical protein
MMDVAIFGCCGSIMRTLVEAFCDDTVLSTAQIGGIPRKVIQLLRSHESSTVYDFARKNEAVLRFVRQWWQAPRGRMYYRAIVNNKDLMPFVSSGTRLVRRMRRRSVASTFVKSTFHWYLLSGCRQKPISLPWHNRWSVMVNNQNELTPVSSIINFPSHSRGQPSSFKIASSQIQEGIIPCEAISPSIDLIYRFLQPKEILQSRGLLLILFITAAESTFPFVYSACILDIIINRKYTYCRKWQK